MVPGHRPDNFCALSVLPNATGVPLRHHYHRITSIVAHGNLIGYKRVRVVWVTDRENRGKLLTFWKFEENWPKILQIISKFKNCIFQQMVRRDEPFVRKGNANTVEWVDASNCCTSSHPKFNCNCAIGMCLLKISTNVCSGPHHSRDLGNQPAIGRAGYLQLIQ